MSKVIGGLIQMGLKGNTGMEPEEIKDLMLKAHLPLVEKAAKQGVQVLCFQEVFTQPYFCPSQDRKWYRATERIPDGPTVQQMQKLAKKHGMVIVVPIYEVENTGVRIYVVDPGDMNTAMHAAAEPGVDLSSLPTPDLIAPLFVRLLDETASFGRFEASQLLTVTM